MILWDPTCIQERSLHVSRVSQVFENHLHVIINTCRYSWFSGVKLADSNEVSTYLKNHKYLRIISTFYKTIRVYPRDSLESNIQVGKNMKIPSTFPLCFNSSCPRKTTCLRYVAGQHIPSKVTSGSAIYPTALSSDGTCPYYREYVKVKLDVLNYTI